MKWILLGLLIRYLSFAAFGILLTTRSCCNILVPFIKDDTNRCYTILNGTKNHPEKSVKRAKGLILPQCNLKHQANISPKRVGIEILNKSIKSLHCNTSAFLIPTPIGLDNYRVNITKLRLYSSSDSRNNSAKPDPTIVSRGINQNYGRKLSVRSFFNRIIGAFNFLKRCINIIIHPSVATKQYYKYAHWRMFERFSFSVLQTMASNIKSAPTNLQQNKVENTNIILMLKNKISESKMKSILATMIFKDAFSRIFHFLWFSEIGVGFDNNPKAFRLLGSILCSTATLIDFVCNVFTFGPKMIMGACTNAVRQIGLLTMSASQGPFYNSFHVKNTATNIGEITAKLEAQNPICDFSGIALGIYLTNLLNEQPFVIQATTVILTSLISNVATYMCVKSVSFKNLNPQRCFVVLEDFASALLRRLDRYLRYHKMRMEIKRQKENFNSRNSDDEESESIESTSSNSCFDDDECGAIAELIYNYEFDTAARLLQRFTSTHLCNKLRASRGNIDESNESSITNKSTISDNYLDDPTTKLPDEPLNLVQKKIKIKFLTPDDIAKKEPLLFPGREGALRMGAIKYSLNEISVCHATLLEYLKIFKGERFVVVLGSDGIVEAAIHRSAKPRDAILAILTYNIAEKLWTVVTESTEEDFIDFQFNQIWEMFKRSAVGLRDVLLHLNAKLENRKGHRLNTDGQQLKEEMETWKRGVQTVIYAYTMAKACIDEVMLNIEAVNWDVDKFELCSPVKG
ncbi:hypothetical protein BEWA_007250 [Theileria equi strain WA]|uniref:Protein root UVB sensitive/RUS domain-containing protein n=1 Tax=Theileria equi strain WA TaxID=1537102 RepID=L0B245_THEEQ|nr:hypothetical protein BEWA_007250 [Theileria equi strain WA]AFZ81316.1 hypothetical protein BEWA_007250 [Theileria equi strain WA]|eukprot:XP_004830982.1 hypothetical protein BEWA_007250 [Theileria equi strain WA]